jgi:hypothetical protein
MLCVSQCRRIFPLRPKPRYSRHARARGLPPDLRLLLLAQLYVLVQLVGLAVKSGRGLLVVVNDISELQPLFVQDGLALLDLLPQRQIFRSGLRVIVLQSCNTFLASGSN